MTIGDAVISPEARYRYSLHRQWSETNTRSVLWVMLNPSTADAEQDDPTITRCIAFSRWWGYGRLAVVNLFALRATKPTAIQHAGFPVAVGPDNDAWIRREAEHADLIIAGWGACRARNGFFGRDQAVRRLLAPYPLYHIGLTRNGGHPRHPLYVRSDTLPQLLPGLRA